MENQNRTGQPWTVEELETVCAAYVAHRPVPEIAKQMGRSYMAIVSRLRRLGLMDDLGNRIEKARTQA
jgi:uncharacterized membrane protein YebE (DUF533 family)